MDKIKYEVKSKFQEHFKIDKLEKYFDLMCFFYESI